MENNFKSNLVPVLSTDTLRPVLQCVHIKNGYLYATNGHVAIKQHLSLHELKELDIQALEGKVIHMDILKLLKQHKLVIFTHTAIKAITTQGEIIYPYVNTANDPDMLRGADMIDKVITDAIASEAQPQSNAIGVSPKYVEIVSKAMLYPNNYLKAIKLTFKGVHKAILMESNGTPLEQQCAIIMPVMLNTDWH